MKTLTERQSDVVEKLEKEFNVDLKNNRKKEVKKEMTNSQDVVTKVKKGKATNVTPVDLEQAEAQAKKFLGEFSGDFNGTKVEETRIGFFNLKLKDRLLVGVKYLLRNGQATYFLIVPENYKNFSPELKGAYAESNWLGEFLISDDTKKFSPIIASIVEKFRAKPAPVAKPVVKPVAKKKNKKIKRTI